MRNMRVGVFCSRKRHAKGRGDACPPAACARLCTHVRRLQVPGLKALLQVPHSGSCTPLMRS